MVDKFPGWRYGPGGKSAVFESEADVPKGWKEHPSEVDGHPVGGGVETASVSANVTTTTADAAKSTDAKSQTMVDPKISAQSGVGGLGTSPASGEAPKSPAADKAELDADGHPYDATLHAATKSKTKDGKWRMKVGVKRPDPAPGYPLDL